MGETRAILDVVDRVYALSEDLERCARLVDRRRKLDMTGKVDSERFASTGCVGG